MTPRVPQWEHRLGEYIAPLADQPFSFGRNDCSTFAAGAVQAMTGVDPMPEMRGRYSTSRGAAYALRKFGAGTLIATMDAKFPRIEPGMAHRGDLVMVEGSLAVCFGHVAVAPGTDPERSGLVRLPRDDSWTHAWHVPFVEDSPRG